MNYDQSDDQNVLKKELHRAHRELSVLYEVSNAMRTTLDLKHILYIILTGGTTHSGLGFNRAILFLVNHVNHCIEPQMPWHQLDANQLFFFLFIIRKLNRYNTRNTGFRHCDSVHNIGMGNCLFVMRDHNKLSEF